MKMKRVLCAAVIALAAAETFGAVYYVAPAGKNTNKGTKDSPFATLNKANSVVNAGDTVWIRGGPVSHSGKWSVLGAKSTNKGRKKNEPKRTKFVPDFRNKAHGLYLD